MTAIGIVPIREIWEDIEHALVSGTFFPYPVVVGLAKLKSGTFWTKSGIMVQNGFWHDEAVNIGFSAGDAPNYSGTDSDYVNIVSEDFILPARVKTVSGHAFISCYFVFSANTGTGGNSTNFRLNAQMFKMDAAGSVSLIGTAAVSSAIAINSLDYMTSYLVAMPFCQEIELEDIFRLGLRISLEGKRVAGTGSVEIGWNFHIFDLVTGFLKRSYALLPIRK